MNSALIPRWSPSRWPWPLPALLSWALAWSIWFCLVAANGSAALAFGCATLAGALPAMASPGLRRRAIAAAGFPLSAWALGAASAWPAWAWLALLLSLLLAYPLRAWRDAPFFPTPAAALRGLERVVGSPACVFDAGCGLGHGLRALHALWPCASVQGVEWSPLLAWAAKLACPWARVRRGDMWQQGWSAMDLVYVFQRPESMARVWDKACRELRPGAWLVSLEFAVPGIEPWARLQHDGQRPLWIYRPAGAIPGSIGAPAGR